MKRLWVRLSLGFSSIIIASMLALFITSLIYKSSPPPDHLRPNLEEISSEDIGEELNRFRDRVLTGITRKLLTVAGAGGVVGIIAGIWISRSLVSPLSELADAARVIGKRELSHRVVVRGSQEIVEVAAAFNQMAAELEQAELLRQNLMTDVAHELRTPLTVLQGNLRAILDDVYALDKEEVTHIYEQTLHLSHLVEDLHELAQAEARQLPLEIQTVNILPHIQTVTEVFESVAAEHDVYLAVDLPDSLPLVRVDTDRLTQVLHNILSNALRHTPAGGTITLHPSANQHEVCIMIKDTGEGIAPEHLPYVFDRFYRVDRSRTRTTGGTGLGLAIVKTIVEALNGRVTVTSLGLGQGTTVALYLPVCE